MLFAWEQKHHSLKNKEVEVYGILVMLPFVIYLTPHIHSLGLTPDDSLVKLCLAHDNSQTVLLKTRLPTFVSET